MSLGPQSRPQFQKPWHPTNFRVKIGGLPAAEFEAIASATNPSREIPAHELAHVVQQQRNAGGTAARRWTLLRGTLTRQALATLQASAKGVVCELAVKDGNPSQRWTLVGVKLVSQAGSRPAAAGGNAIAFEQIVISHEGMS